MANFDDLKLAVEALTGGKNTVIMDDMGMPSIMVVWPKQNNKDIIKGGSDRTHYGSIVNEVEKTMYVSKYQNIIVNDRGYSLPFQDPANSLNFDRALQVCRNKGKGWGLMPHSLWSQIALWTKANETMPRGNNNYGQDIERNLEKAVETAKDGTKTGRTATGSGPATWNHNWLPDGIADMNGNVWEWCAGLRIKDGELQIIPNANCMDPEVSLGASSTAWKAIKSDGSLVDPGTSGTLKYDNKAGITLCTTITNSSASGAGVGFTSMPIESGLTAPEIAKGLILYPDNPSSDYGGDDHYMVNQGECLPLLGGGRASGSGAGVFGLHLNYARSTADRDIGFRSAFCDL